MRIYSKQTLRFGASQKQFSVDMKLLLRIISLLLLFSGTFSQEGFDLADALDDLVPTAAKPKADKPKEDEGGFGLDLEDALGPDPPKKPTDGNPKSGGSDSGFDLTDAFGPDDNPKPDRPAVKPPKSGGGGGGESLSDLDLFDLTDGGGDGNYNPDGGRSGGGSRDPNYDPNYGGGDQPQEAGSGQIAGIVSAVGVALMGAASSYFAYQKKKLCFKLQGGADPEKGQRGTHSQPQVLSNLLQSN